MNLQVDIQVACSETVPDDEDICRWIAAALEGRRSDAELCVRLASEVEMAELNGRYRGKPAATNVLAFPAQLPDELALNLLGDLVICPAVVAREAREQHKTLSRHWAHMCVHGSLHLLGYDHIDPEEARAMEALETAILQSLGCPCPYTPEPAPELLESL